MADPGKLENMDDNRAVVLLFAACLFCPNPQ